MSKYTVTEQPDGFRVEGDGRNPVTVTLKTAHIEVEYGREPFELDCRDTSVHSLLLYDYYGLSARIAEGVMHYWEPPEDKCDEDGFPTWPNVRIWVRKQTARAIGKRVHTQWKRLLTMASPDVLAVHRAVFSANVGGGFGGDLIMDEELYRHRWIVSDIINYRAAAVAVFNARGLVLGKAENTLESNREYQEIVDRAGELRQLAERHGLANVLHLIVSPHVEPPTTSGVIDALHDWRGLFSPDGTSYRSLDRTLMNLPGGIPGSLLCELNRRKLERPIFNRLELLVALLDRAIWTHPTYHRNYRIYEHATAGQIKEAMRRVAEHTHNDLSPRRARHVRWFMKFLADLPAEHNGNIVGLADRAILWHRAERERNIEEQIRVLGGNTQTAEPPIPLPDDPGLRFLATVEDVCREGHDMEHCVASYAGQAVHGKCYLFHAEYEGDSATVEVGPDGSIIQAHGPRNRINGAAKRAMRTLRRWGDGIPEGALPIVKVERAEIVPNADIPF